MFKLDGQNPIFPKSSKHTHSLTPSSVAVQYAVEMCAVMILSPLRNIRVNMKNGPSWNAICHVIFSISIVKCARFIASRRMLSKEKGTLTYSYMLSKDISVKKRVKQREREKECTLTAPFIACVTYSDIKTETIGKIV